MPMKGLYEYLKSKYQTYQTPPMDSMENYFSTFPVTIRLKIAPDQLLSLNQNALFPSSKGTWPLTAARSAMSA